MQGEAPVADADGVARVRPPAVARHDVHALGQKIDDLSFAFIAPLRADHDETGHGISQRSDRNGQRGTSGGSFAASC